MRRHPGFRRLLQCGCALLWALAAAAGPGRAATAAPATPVPPELRVDAPPQLWGEAATLHAVHPTRWNAVQRLVGLPRAGAPITVRLVPEDDPVARHTPRPISGFAVPAENVVVLLPQRVPSYPSGSLEELLVHEVTHVLLARAAGGAALPRWFHEGVALVAAHGWDLGDRGRLLAGGMGGGPTTTAELERAFAGGQGEVDAAYALSGALAQELLRRHGRGAVAEIAAELAAGRSFDDGFAAATGEDLATFESGFWRRFRLVYRWLPFLTSAATLWLAITLLAVVAGARRRARDAAIRRRWDEEELALLRAAELAAIAGPGGGLEDEDDDDDDDGEADDDEGGGGFGRARAHESRWGPH